jgi:membrane-anchored protein YejM (alkaline phosphatase superfamily)
VQEPAVDESTGTLLSLLEGYDDPLFDRTLLSALEATVEQADPSRPEAEAAAQTLAWLLADGEDDPWPALWSAAGVAFDPNGPDETAYPELTRESLQQALRALRARGQLRVSGRAAGR